MKASRKELNKDAPKTKREKYYSLDGEEVLSKLSSSKGGLSVDEAENRLKKYGPNLLPEGKKKSLLLLFIKQFHSFLVYILLIAAAIAFYVDHVVDFYVIVVIVMFNAAMGFVQEYKAEKAVEALQNMISPHARVYRDGEIVDVEAKNIVPGDIVHLEAGDKVPADARVLNQSNLRTEEASLTGESAPISKNKNSLPENTGLADRKNMVWMGTFVADGQCDAIVVATGADTAFGKIAQSISNIKKTKSHFEKKTDALAKKVGALAILGATATFFVGFFVIEPKPELADLSIFVLASLVSGIPEGLPAILAVVLAIGARRMAARNAIVKTLPAGETLGVADTIITDKTGTLTQNTMTVERVVMASGKSFYVSGSGWSNEGNFYEDSKKEKETDPKKNEDLSKLIQISAICNSATVKKDKESKKEYSIIGDPTEAGIVVLAEKAGATKKLVTEKEGEIISDFPFSQQLKYRASIFQPKEGKKREFFVVGAPEIILEGVSYYLDGEDKKKINQEKKEEIHRKIEGMAHGALRVLGLAYREVDSNAKEFSEDLAEDLVFVGLVGMKDPARPEVPSAIVRARKAGVRVIMATGDHKETAFAIAKEVGLVEGEIDADGQKVLTGSEVEAMSKRELKKAVNEVQVFARLEPDTKLKIADALQKQGHVVAMTGDGVNDAPALKKADIGIAMGIIGTDVAREASKVILTDDNFATIVNAIEEGRIIFGNVRQASTFLVTTNIAEDFTIVLSMFKFHEFPLLATQILWLNLVTDGAAGLPLATEKAANKDVLSRPPKNPKEHILSGKALPWLFIMGGVMVFATMLVFSWFLEDGVEKARTGAFTVMAFTQIFNMFNMRSLTMSIFSLGVFSNKFVNIGFVVSLLLQVMVVYTPFFQNVFGLVPLSAKEFVAIIILSSSVLWIGEAYKALKKKMGWFQDY